MKKLSVLDLFEIKRPAKISLRKASSVSNIDEFTNKDEISPKERLFIRNSGTLPSTRSSRRYKKKKPIYEEQQQDKVISNNNMEDNPISVKLLAKKFDSVTEIKQVRHKVKNHSFSETSQYKNSNGEAEDHIETFKTEAIVEPRLENGIMIPNAIVEFKSQSYFEKKIRSRSESSFQTNKMERKIMRKDIKSFSEAETDDELEKLRKSLSQEMAKEFENMKLDGFIDEAENVVCTEEYTTVTEYKNDSVSNTTNELYSSCEDEFSEGLGDLEDGAYVVESYNDEGRELIIVHLSIDRKAVNLNSLQSIKEVIEESELVFFENDNRTLSVVDDPIDIVNKPAEEPIYEEIQNYGSSSQPSRSSQHFPELKIDDKEYCDVFYDEDVVRKRSHVLSMVSTGSSQGEEDEGIGESYESVYNSIRRETFCDNQGNIRIERIGYPEKQCEDNNTDSTGKPLSRNNSIPPTKKLLYLIDELKNTETKYVEDLEKIVKTYIPYIKKHTPPQLEHRLLELVGNISRICRKQKKFLKAVLSCEEDVNLIAMAFLEHEYLFDLYPLYLQNKPKSDMILKEFQPILKQMQEYFGERLDFSAYLLTPLQRLGKYILFIESMEKELKILQLSCEHTQKALKMIKSIMSRGNDCVAIESIQKSLISRVDYGSFIMRDKFTITKPRRLDSMVFLFSNVVVFTVEDQKCLELFTYYDSIKMDELRIATFEDGTIHLIDFTKTKRSHFNPQQHTFVLETKVDKVRNTWRETIEQMLWQQLAREKANSLKFLQPQEPSSSSSKTNTKRKQTNKRRPKSLGGSRFYTS